VNWNVVQVGLDTLCVQAFVDLLLMAGRHLYNVEVPGRFCVARHLLALYPQALCIELRVKGIAIHAGQALPLFNEFLQAGKLAEAQGGLNIG